MKVNKTICLDEKLIAKLKNEANSSELIESLLFKHYEITDAPKRTEEELLKELKIIEIQQEALMKIKEIENV